MIKHKQQQNVSSDSGFTIIESLIAILVAALLLAAIAPVIVFSTATRLQSRRVELATRVAKTFIDGVRTGAIAAPSTVSTLTAPTSDAPRRISDIPAVAATETTPAVPAVTGKPQDYLFDTTKMPAPTSATGLYCFTSSGSITTSACTEKTSEFYIQAGRIVQSTKANDGYRLAVRVYRADVDFNQTVKASTKTTSSKQTPYAAGLGDRQAPLIEMTTDVANSNTTFDALCQRLGTATNKTCQ